MPKYIEFWNDMIARFAPRLNKGLESAELVDEYSGITYIGNRSTGYDGYLNAFAFSIEKHSNSQVFKDLAEALNNHKIKQKLVGELNVRVSGDTVSFQYEPFSWQLMMDRYREHQKKRGIEDELYKWKLVAREQKRWMEYDTGTITFTDWINNIDWENLVYHMFPPNFRNLVNARPEKCESVILRLFDDTRPLQERIIETKDELEHLFEETKGKPSDRLFLNERELSTLLTIRFPDRYTFYLNGFYSTLLKVLGRKQPKKWYKLTDYYEIVNEFKQQALPQHEDVIAKNKKLTDHPDCYSDDEHMLLIQDILYITLNPNSSSTETNESEMTEESKDRKFWLYAPGANASKWDEFRDNGMMALEWEELGDLNQYKSKKAIVERLQKLENTTGSKKNDSTANWEFKNVMQPGDVVIAKKGKKEFLGYGIVTSDYYYDTSRKGFKSCRKVNWIKNGSWSDDDHDIVTKTLTDITKYADYVIRLKKLMGIDEDGTTPPRTHQQPENQILYGPPGTGKTYRLKNEYFERYTTRETSVSPEQHFEDVAADLSWWQVSALALLELKEAKVAEIKQNRWVQHKVGHSASKNLNATIWGTLQTHALEESETVSYKQRQPPLIFDKSDGSRWRILEEQVKEQAPELLDILDSVNNFKPDHSKTIERYVFTTFHQSYSYEDFLEGIKPVMEDESDGNIAYRIEPGIFKKLCDRAAKDRDHRYAIFIDEINRGNIANIFGELITLIEPDKRAGGENPMSATLPYSKTKFTVPSNVDIYGTMNTADRSVEALDTALRRRFSFREMMPQPELIDDKLGEKATWKGISLSEVLKTINDRIEVLVDRDHAIGHSYFLCLQDEESFDAALKAVFTDKIIPLLQEYFYNDYVKIGMVLGNGFVKTDKEEVKFADFEDSLAGDYENGVRMKLIPPDDIELEEALLLLLNQKKPESTDGES